MKKKSLLDCTIDEIIGNIEKSQRLVRIINVGFIIFAIGVYVFLKFNDVKIELEDIIPALIGIFMLNAYGKSKLNNDLNYRILLEIREIKLNQENKKSAQQADAPDGLTPAGNL